MTVSSLSWYSSWSVSKASTKWFLLLPVFRRARVCSAMIFFVKLSVRALCASRAAFSFLKKMLNHAGRNSAITDFLVPDLSELSSMFFNSWPCSSITPLLSMNRFPNVSLVMCKNAIVLKYSRTTTSFPLFSANIYQQTRSFYHSDEQIYMDFLHVLDEEV